MWLSAARLNALKTTQTTLAITSNRMGIHTTRLHSPRSSADLESSAIDDGTRQATCGEASSSSPRDSSKQIHVLGIGNIGKLFAHALATKPLPPPIILLLHRKNLLDAWEEAGRVVEVITNDIANREGAFGVEVIGSPTNLDQEHKTIDNLIVATKTLHTTAALQSIRRRLGPSSTILFAQNGMGTIEEVSAKVFPDVHLRPRFLSCVNNHGIYTHGPFSCVHAGLGTVTISAVEGGRDIFGDQPSYLAQQVVGAPLLAARAVSSEELMLLQFDKLVVNAMINPLTVIFDRKNGDLFSSRPIARLMSLLLPEVGHVIRSLPELQNLSSVSERFSTSGLHDVVLNVAQMTAMNTSSMLQDVRAGRTTEIDYINGYIVRRGLELGIDCNNNERLIALVKETHVVGEDEIGKYFLDYV